MLINWQGTFTEIKSVNIEDEEEEEMRE